MTNRTIANSLTLHRLSLLATVLALLWFAGGPCRADTVVVDSVTPGTGTTLSDAIAAANTLPDPPHTIVFAIEGVYFPPTPLDPLAVDGTQIRGDWDESGSACTSDGPRFSLHGLLLGGEIGLVVDASSCVITGLEIVGFDLGISIAPGRKHNRIGAAGPESCERLWIHGNDIGIRLALPETNENEIRNCRVYANTANGIELLGGPSFNIIGAAAQGERNYIYGNGANGIKLDTDDEIGSGWIEGNHISGNYIYNNGVNGIYCTGTGNPYTVHDNVMEANSIGVDETGAAAGNGYHGVQLRTASPSNAILNNVIVDNDYHGVQLLEWSHYTTLSGNAIGVTAAGDPMGNHRFGIYSQTNENAIGPDNLVAHNGDGTTDCAGIGLIGSVSYNPQGNTISSNTIVENAGRGVMIMGDGVTENTLLENYIGTDAYDNCLGNEHGGVLLDEYASANYIFSCVIGCNSGFGVMLDNHASSNKLYGNHIGTDASDTIDLGNAVGIRLRTEGNSLGSSSTGQGNSICFNDNWGIRVSASDTIRSNAIVNNFIGTNANEDPMGNGLGGIWFGNGAVNNDVGDWPATPNAGNTIMFNGGPGVKVGDPGSPVVPVQNRILTNRICDNAAEPIVLLGGGNDMLPPPIITSGGNDFLGPAGGFVGTVSGEIGYSHPPFTQTRVQVFYSSADTCGAYYGSASVPGFADSWSLQGDPLPPGCEIYATESTGGPDVPPEPFMQTSGVSESAVWSSWVSLDRFCLTVPCPWLGTEALGRCASWVDFDLDGFVDLFLCNAGSENRMLRNLGDRTFELADVGELGLAQAVSVAAAWADADNDGDYDVYLVNAASANQLFVQDTSGTFHDMTPPAMADEGEGRAAAWSDYDLDGDLDLFLTNYGTADKLFRNEGGLSFSDQTAVIEQPGWEGWTSVGAAWADYDQDGDADLYVVDATGPNHLLRNEGPFGFTDATAGALGDGGAGRGVIWGDFQNDGLLDLYIVNHDGPNRLLKNLGPGGYAFADVTAGPEGDPNAGRSVCAGDFDLDADLDLYIVNDPAANVLLLNQGTGEFSLIDDPMPMPEGVHFASAPADFDQDGDVELFVVHGEGGEDNLLFVNAQASGHHWLKVELNGSGSNKFGIGGIIEVTADRTVQTRQVSAGTGSIGQASVTEEFGLGGIEHVEMIRVIWPSGLVSELCDVASDRLIVIDEPTFDAVEQEPEPHAAAPGLLPCSPNPIHPDARIGFVLSKGGPALLQIFDSSGRLVRVLTEGHHGPGRHAAVWDGRDRDGQAVPAGVYFVRFTSEGVRQRRTVTLVR